MLDSNEVLKMSETETSNISYHQHTNARRLDSRNSRLYSQADDELEGQYELKMSCLRF